MNAHNALQKSENGGVSNTSRDKRPRFEKAELLGKGTFGRVYEALDKDYGELVAVKVLKLSSQANDKQRTEEINEIRNEISILSKLSHPNIVRYVHSQFSDENPNEFELIMEMVSGGSIRQLLDKFQKFEEGLVKIYT
jgi:serine/threonine protein kinase